MAHGTDAEAVVMVGTWPTPAGELLGLLAASRPAWHADALCREYPQVNFFPEKGGDVRPAQAVCSHCIVAADCRAWALAQDGRLHGIWSGTTHAHRKRLRAAAAA